ncbi:hypothetical protein K466DRAFT_136198 [Polyporus arcularius HHB13444]|uniref:Uncharacterized protein n=1 Tax=Polyporus arcularius HHB13444 TaxID=1314778 RepID=A0A5C3PC74_9APHY|nr:hypothetical protein K466DRAFT_136198 [Polyporus arcularius HHB13444]
MQRMHPAGSATKCPQKLQELDPIDLPWPSSGHGHVASYVGIHCVNPVRHSSRMLQPSRTRLRTSQQWTRSYQTPPSPSSTAPSSLTPVHFTVAILACYPGVITPSETIDGNPGCKLCECSTDSSTSSLISSCLVLEPTVTRKPAGLRWCPEYVRQLPLATPLLLLGLPGPHRGRRQRGYCLRPAASSDSAKHENHIRYIP